MTSPEKKRRKKTAKKPSPSPALLPTAESTPIPSLPHELLVSCLACVPRLYYPTLSLVSKSTRSLIASPELNDTRVSLGKTEKCLYVCLQFHPDRYSRWYTLCMKPDQVLNNENKDKRGKKKSSGYVLSEIKLPDSSLQYWYCPVVVGSEIYNIGGPVEYEHWTPSRSSSAVSVLDCRSNTVREAPSMQVERVFPKNNVVDGKIYVAGGWDDISNVNYMEVFDVKTQAWEFVPSPEEVSNFIQKSAVIDGKVYLFGDGTGMAYNTKEGKWEDAEPELIDGWVHYSYCVIDNVLYYYWDGGFRWYDSNARGWRMLKGVKGLPKFSRYHAKMTEYGGKMAVLWEKVLASTGYNEKLISCAVIALERRGEYEMWGKVEWQGTLLKAPKACILEHAICVTV